MTKSEVWSMLTETEAKRLMTRGNPILCCVHEQTEDALIQIGETFIRKRKTGQYAQKQTVRYYHERCWLRTFH